MTTTLASCKYGAECAYVVGCACDCCDVDHPCECDEGLDEGDDGFDPNACPGCGGNCQTACR